MDEATVNGIRLAYRAAGSPDAPPLVLLHALGEDSTSWEHVIAACADDWRVYVPDLRGHGRSDWPGEYSFERMRDDVLGLLDALGLARVALVGHSLGGVVGYLLAEEHPDRISTLVLEDPPAPLPANREMPVRPDGPETFDWGVVTGTFRQRNDPDPAWWANLTAITARTLIIAGGTASHIPQDTLAEMAARIPDCRLVTIEAGHEVHVTRPDEFLAALTAFLS